MVIIPYSDISNEIQSNIEQLQNWSQIDADTQLRLWQETFLFRRKVVRDGSTNDIMKKFSRL